MERSGRVMAMVESRMFCVRLVDMARFNPMLGKVRE
jgi:hypothetical protein